MNSIFYGEMMEFLSLREKVLTNKTITMDRCALLSFDQHLAQRGKSELLINEDNAEHLRQLFDSFDELLSDIFRPYLCYPYNLEADRNTLMLNDSFVRYILYTRFGTSFLVSLLRSFFPWMILPYPGNLYSRPMQKRICRLAHNSRCERKK